MTPPETLRAPWWRSIWPWVAAAAALAVIVRLLHLQALIGADPLLIVPMVDAEAYHEWAVAILDDPLGDKVFFQSPGYPYLIAAIYALTGPDWSAVAVVQAIAAGLQVLLVAGIARRLAPVRKSLAACTAAWIMALYQPLIFYSALLLKVEFTNFFMLLCLYAFLKGLETRPAPTPWLWMVLAGLVMGVLGLFRGNFYLALPALVAWIPILAWWRRRKGDQDAHTRRQAAATAMAFVLGFVIIVALVSVRNKAVADQWVFSSAGSGAVLYIGNNPYTPSGDYAHLPFLRTHPRFEEVDMRAEAERRLGHPLTTQEASRYWRSEALRYTLDEPGAAALRALNKLKLTAESYELGDNYSLTFHGYFSPFVGQTIPWWTLILALSAGWLAMARGHRAAAMPLLILLATYAASLIIFFVRSRYRIPMAPLMMILAGIEVALLAEAAARKSHRDLGLHAIPIALVAALSLGTGLPRLQGERMGNWWMALGLAHAEQGDDQGAYKLLRKALEVQPDESIIWMNLGRIDLGRGRLEPAARACARAIEMDKARDDARECLALARQQLGELPAAWAAIEPSLSDTMPLMRFHLATGILVDLDRRPEAIALARRGAPKYTGDPDFHLLMASVLRFDHPDEARAQLQRAIAATEDPARRAHYESLLESLPSGSP